MQRINLYLPEFRPREELLDFNQLLWAFVGMIFLFSALGWWTSSNIDLLEQQYEQQAALIGPMEKQKAELDKMLASRPQEDRLDREILSLQDAIQQKAKALETLKISDVKGSQGYSALLTDLAFNKPQQIWLTDISLSNDVLSLHGQTTSPPLITEWIETATQHKTLNRRFSAIDIKQNSNDSRVYDFIISGGVIVHYDR